MSEYTRQVLKVVVAKICQTIGWHSINSTSMDIMVDLLRRYLMELTRTTHAYSTLFGHTQPNLDELGLAFRDMHINIADLEEYIQYVEATPPIEVPLYPVPKESHLNFLKPGSNEVVTRPVHIHEHLPPMLPDADEVDPTTVTPKEEPPSSPSVEFSCFKRPPDICDTPSKRPRLLIEEEGRPTREISSVMMTTSGFLSPAREGKLPEARTPINAIEPINTINEKPVSVPNAAPAPPRVEKKFVNKTIKEKTKGEKRNRDKSSKELFKPDISVSTKKVPVKKPKLELTSKNANMISPIEVIEKPMIKNSNKTSPGGRGKFKKNDKNMNLPAVTIEKIPMVPEKVVEEKLPSEHDKVKLNIFKKISKVKDDKVDKTEKKHKEEIRNEIISTTSRESSPDLIIDESDKNDKLDKPNKFSEQNNKLYDIVKNSPHSDKDFMYDDYMSPPGTPLTPKTPEMPTHSPPIKSEKRKKKEKTKLKNQKTPKSNNRNKILNPEPIDLEMERPKTPDPPINLIKSELNLPHPNFPFLPNFNTGPGLIPPLLPNPIFPKLNPLNLKPGFGQPAQISPAPFPFVPIKPQTPQEVLNIPSHSGLEITPVKDETEIIPIKEKHKKDKKDKMKKKNKKDKIKNKSEKRKIKEEKKEKDKVKKIKKEKKKDKEREHEGSVPKLTLKISSPRPPTPDAQVTRKIMIKPVVKKEEPPTPPTPDVETRQPSPELARISALITRPPKLKTKESHGKDEVSHTPKVNGAGRGRPSNLSKAATQAVLHDEKPLAGKPPKPVALPPPPPVVQESEENKIWICPACGRQDDGTPMIGCDNCDEWYHWVCVGIQVPPDDNEDWYCRICIVKKQEMLQVDKKKKRKKKEKKGID